jgi:transposase
MWPHDVLPKHTVDDDCAQWRGDGTWTRLVKALRKRYRMAAGREPTPNATCMDRPSVKTTARGGPEPLRGRFF